MGHTGTLDPFATGLLVVLVGRATRLARFVEAQAKTYLATARLGVATDTDDLTGARRSGDAGRASGRDRATVREALAGFLGRAAAAAAALLRQARGRRAQLPAGPPRGDGGAAGDRGDGARGSSWWRGRRPSSSFRATVSAGTYIRAMARDLGERLGVGGHLTALRREAIGALRVEEAVPLDAARTARRCCRPAPVLRPSAGGRAGRGGAARRVMPRARGAGGARRAGRAVVLWRARSWWRWPAGSGWLAAGRGPGDAVMASRRPPSVLPRARRRKHRDGRLVRRRAPRAPGGAAGDRRGARRQRDGPACW